MNHNSTTENFIMASLSFYKAKGKSFYKQNIYIPCLSTFATKRNQCWQLNKQNKLTEGVA